MTRKQLFNLHGWLGLAFGLILTLVCLSGTLATLIPEIEWASQSTLRIQAEGQVRWDATYDALRRAYPDHAVASIERLADAGFDGIAWQAHLVRPDGGWIKARVDPYTAEIVRPGSRLYLDDYVWQLHYNFFSNWGFYLVCFVALPLVLSILSGLLFHRRWWRSLVFLRVGKGARPFWSSVHRCLGVWSAIFGFLIGLTGLWYLIEGEVVPYDIAYPAAPRISAAKMAAHGPMPRPLSIAEHVAAAESAFPDLEPNGVSLPGAPGDTVMVRGAAGTAFVRDRANAVFLDPYDAEVVEVRRSAEMPALSWWVNAADPLHFGYIGGIATKLLWTGFGLSLPAIMLSGAYLSRRRARVPNRRAARRAPLRSIVAIPVLLLLGWSCLDGYAERRSEPTRTTAVGDGPIGPWRVSVRRDQTARADEPTRYVVRFHTPSDRVASFRTARVRVTPTRGGASAGAQLSGSPRAARAAVAIPPDAGFPRTVRLVVEGWSGERWTAAFTDDPTAAGPDADAATGPARYRDAPAAPAVFYGVVGGLALLLTVVAVVWVRLEVRDTA